MDVGGIETSLFEIHALLAAFTIPQMALERDEARALAIALAEVQRHYPQVRILNEKQMSLAALGITATRIYGKRVVMIMGAPTKPRGEQSQHFAPPLNVTPADDGGGQPASWFANGGAPDGHTH